MSTCPSKDLHSVYLDNELPESYKAEYENHIAGCQKCQAELKKLKALRALFASGQNEVHFTEKQMDESYARLLARMSYSKNVQKSKKPASKFKASFGYAIGAVAAVAAFAFIVPARIAGLKIQSVDFQPVARTSMGNYASQVSYDETLRNADLSSVFADESNQAYMSLASLKTRSSTSSTASRHASFASYDVFYTDPYSSKTAANEEFFSSPEEFERSRMSSELNKPNLLFQYDSAYNSDSDF